jgi:hypothetical protein
VNEHEYEPIPGLPALLPAGETILWQGAPDWRSLARRAFHVRQLGVYFAVILLLRVAFSVSSGMPISEALWSTCYLLPFAIGAVGVLTVLAWLTARATIYTITNRRVVIRFGIALQMTLNLPFVMIPSAGLRSYSDGTGDIPLALQPGQRVAYLVVWPHIRPWRVARTEPMLRCVPDAQRVAQTLARALSAASDQPARPVPEVAPELRTTVSSPIAA